MAEHLSGHEHLGFQGQLFTLEHHVEVDPLEHHLAPVVEVAFAQEGEGSQAREGVLARQGFDLVVEVDEAGLFIAGDDEAGGVAVELRQGLLAVDLPAAGFPR